MKYLVNECSITIGKNEILHNDDEIISIDDFRGLLVSSHFDALNLDAGAAVLINDASGTCNICTVLERSNELLGISDGLGVSDDLHYGIQENLSANDNNG